MMCLHPHLPSLPSLFNSEKLMSLDKSSNDTCLWVNLALVLKNVKLSLRCTNMNIGCFGSGQPDSTFHFFFFFFNE